MWLGDLLGRRKVIMIGAVWMVVGAILQCTSFGVTQLAIARVVTGVGNGMNTATIPTWQSECSPAHLRGKLIMVRFFIFKVTKFHANIVDALIRLRALSSREAS